MNATDLLQQITLYSGGHTPDSQQMCAMEAVAFIAGEPWSDSPECTCPTIAAFMRGWNDGLPSNTDRDRLLKPLIPKVIGTKGSAELSERRSYMVIDWFIRVHTPAFLRLTPSLIADADRLAAMEPITSLVGLKAHTAALQAARENAAAARAAAWDAAWDAARDAARDAAWDAARDAARAAAGDAAWDAARAAARAAAWDAAWAAAWDAAGDAARAAAWDAAWDAAWKRLAPTVASLQESASALVLAMCELKD